jgi:hypothetical protein
VAANTGRMPSPASRWSVGNALVLVFVGLTLVIVVIGALRLRGGDEEFKLEPGVPTEASATDLRGFATPSRPVYWIGFPASGRLEVTQASREEVYVRYLPDGVELGDDRPEFTTIATYSMENAYATMQREARTRKLASARLDGGGLAVWSRSPGTSVYVAYPRVNYLVEVYDPSPARARSLAIGGRVRRVS